MITSTPHDATVFVLLISAVSLTPLGAAPTAAQAAERSARFTAAELPIAAVAPAVPLVVAPALPLVVAPALPQVVAPALPASRRAVAVMGPVEDFAFIMGIVGGATIGALVGCAMDCSGDDGISGAAFTGAMIGIPVGVALMVWAVRRPAR